MIIIILLQITSIKYFSSSICILKIRKVIVERKRRERIDRCLDQLKDLILSSKIPGTNNEENASGNMEKADILELTLRHLVDLRTRVQLQRTNGWLACLKEIDSFLRQSPSCSRSLRQRILYHLQLKQCDDNVKLAGEVVGGSPRHPLSEQNVNIQQSLKPFSIQSFGGATVSKPIQNFSTTACYDVCSDTNQQFYATPNRCSQSTHTSFMTSDLSKTSSSSTPTLPVSHSPGTFSYCLRNRSNASHLVSKTFRHKMYHSASSRTDSKECTVSVAMTSTRNQDVCCRAMERENDEDVYINDGVINEIVRTNKSEFVRLGTTWRPW